MAHAPTPPAHPPAADTCASAACRLATSKPHLWHALASSWSNRMSSASCFIWRCTSSRHRLPLILSRLVWRPGGGGQGGLLGSDALYSPAWGPRHPAALHMACQGGRAASADCANGPHDRQPGRCAQPALPHARPPCQRRTSRQVMTWASAANPSRSLIASLSFLHSFLMSSSQYSLARDSGAGAGGWQEPLGPLAGQPTVLMGSAWRPAAGLPAQPDPRWTPQR